MLLGVEVDDELLVDVLRNLNSGGQVEKLTYESLGVEVEPRVLSNACYAVLDDLKAL